MMDKVLKVILISLLVVSALALWFSIKLFPQREELKGRTQKLEVTIHKIAAATEQSDDNPAFVSINDNQLKTFRQLPDGSPSMDEPLNRLTMAAQNQLARLNETRQKVVDTENDLAQTRESLHASQSEVASKNDTIREKDENIAELQASLAERESNINSMKRAEKELSDKVGTLVVAIDDLEIQKKDLQDQIGALERKVTSLEAHIDPDVTKSQMAQGHLGVVLFANPEWNFVVLGFDKDNPPPLTPKLEFLIHRADQLVTKVRVESVVDNMAVAEILSDWQKLTPREGDNVML